MWAINPFKIVYNVLNIYEGYEIFMRLSEY